MFYLKGSSWLGSQDVLGFPASFGDKHGLLGCWGRREQHGTNPAAAGDREHAVPGMCPQVLVGSVGQEGLSLSAHPTPLGETAPHSTQQKEKLKDFAIA